MVSKKLPVQSCFKRDTEPINSLQSDGTINFNDSLGNISNINLTINDCSQNMCQLKQLLLLTLFAVSIVNFTLTILNTQNITVNNILLQQINATTAIISRDISRISNHLTGMDSWKYVLNYMNYFDGFFCNLGKFLTPIYLIFLTKPICLLSLFGIFTQIIVCIYGKPAILRHLLGCILWSYNLYLQEKGEVVEDNILCRVVCSTLILILIFQILLTPQQEVKVYNLNISDTSPKTSKVRINRGGFTVCKDINNRFDLNNDLIKRQLNCSNNYKQNNLLKIHENIVLGSEPKKMIDKPLNFDNFSKVSSKNSTDTNINVIDSYCDLLKNLKLNTNANHILNNASPHFRQKEYGVTNVPDIFVKKSQLSPTRLQTVSQESWVAGGYWKHYHQCEFVTTQFKNNQLFKSPTTLSRSSSQSSGFSSQSGDQLSYVESSNSRNSVTNPKFCLPQYDDRLSVRSEPAYHSNF